MEPTRLAEPGRRSLAALTLLVFCLGGTGCALVVPKSWRVGTPVPLAGPIHANDEVTEGLDAIPTDELVRQVEADREQLVALAADTESETVAEHKMEEARDVAMRLPALQEELAARGAGAAGPRVRHPTIR